MTADGFSETVSKNPRGRPRKHLDLHAMGTAHGGNPFRSSSARNNANGHYSLIALSHLKTLDQRFAWIWRSQVVRTEVGRVIEKYGADAATDLIEQIAGAHPDGNAPAHKLAEDIRASRLGRGPTRGLPSTRQLVADLNTWARVQVILGRATEIRERRRKHRRLSQSDRDWLEAFENAETAWLASMGCSTDTGPP